MQHDKLLTRHEVAQILNISMRMLDEQTYKRAIRSIRIGRAVRYQRKAVDEFIEASSK